MQIKILSFNVWDIPFWFSVKRHERAHRLGDYLKKIDADIICLQEAFDVKHRDEIHETLGKKTYYVTESNGETRRVLLFKRFDLTGGLVIFSKLPIVKNRFVVYRRFVDMMFAEYIGRKGVLEAMVMTPAGPLMIMNTHLHTGNFSIDHNVRLKQFRQLFRATKAVKNMPILITGDFNENNMFKEKDSLRLLTKAGFRDGAENSKEAEKPTTRLGNRYASKTWFNRSKVSRRIDYITVNNLEDFGWRIADYKVLEQPVNALSDHDPVVITIE